MNLREILDSVSNEADIEVPNASIEKIAEETSPVVTAPNEDIEKIASTLEALAEEDTLMDEIAKLAVLADFNSEFLEKEAFAMPGGGLVRKAMAGWERAGARRAVETAVRKGEAQALEAQANRISRFTDAKRLADAGDPTQMNVLKNDPDYADLFAQEKGGLLGGTAGKALIGAGLLGAGALGAGVLSAPSREQRLKDTAEAYYKAGLRQARSREHSGASGGTI